MSQNITLNDWQYFRQIQEIARGTFGCVILVEDTRNKKRYAVKQIPVDNNYDQEKEITILEDINRYQLDEIIKYFGHFRLPVDYFFLFYEPALGCLFDLIPRLKPNFGTAKDNSAQVDTVSNTICGTSIWMSPELFQGMNTTDVTIPYNPFKSDVYSLGLCILSFAYQNLESFNLVERAKEFNCNPFDFDFGPNDNALQQKINNIGKQFQQDQVEVTEIKKIQCILLHMLQYNPTKRLDFFSLYDLCKQMKFFNIDNKIEVWKSQIQFNCPCSSQSSQNLKEKLRITKEDLAEQQALSKNLQDYVKNSKKSKFEETINQFKTKNSTIQKEIQEVEAKIKKKKELIIQTKEKFVQQEKLKKIQQQEKKQQLELLNEENNRINEMESELKNLEEQITNSSIKISDIKKESEKIQSQKPLALASEINDYKSQVDKKRQNLKSITNDNEELQVDIKKKEEILADIKNAMEKGKKTKEELEKQLENQQNQQQSIEKSKRRSKLYRCPQQHPLIYTGPEHINRNCDLCKTKALSETFRCDECDFDVCLECEKKRNQQSGRKSKHYRCKKDHDLVYTGPEHESRRCDLCKTNDLYETFSCEECDANICLECETKKNEREHPLEECIQQ